MLRQAPAAISPAEDPSSLLISMTYNHGSQHRYEGTEPATLLDQGLPDRLLLCFFQQQVLIVDILEGAVQLRLNIASSCQEDKA